jgi:glutathionylspermidine synthase
MLRVPIQERPNWRALAEEYGFHFHTMHSQPYWDETAYYQFRLDQIETDLEAPTAELHQMCLQVVDEIVASEQWMQRFCIPEPFRDAVRDSWQQRDPSLYSRLDLVYNGQGDAKLLENNGDTPTSLYETGFWQWLWLEDSVKSGRLRRDSDQFNSLQEKLIERLGQIANKMPLGERMYFSCSRDTDEDRGTVQYLEDCANEAGIETAFIHIEDIGRGEDDSLTDLDDQAMRWVFKLYPWEFLFQEEFGSLILKSPTQWLEPLWKSLLSNKALLPALWQKFPGHPNLLPAFFSEDEARKNLKDFVKKPIFSREGANVTIYRNGEPLHAVAGPYGQEGFIYQAYQPLPQFGDNYTLIGSWLVDDAPAGISVREDLHPITQDLSRYLPHIILG